MARPRSGPRRGGSSSASTPLVDDRFGDRSERLVTSSQHGPGRTCAPSPCTATANRDATGPLPMPRARPDRPFAAPGGVRPDGAAPGSGAAAVAPIERPGVVTVIGQQLAVVARQRRRRCGSPDPNACAANPSAGAVCRRRFDPCDRPAVAPRVDRRYHSAMSNDHAQPSPDEVADQIMEDAEGGIESSTLDAPDDASDSAEPD